jgi:hypothetical protein
MIEVYGWISGIQSIQNISNNSWDYPPKERMCRKDFRVSESMGKIKASLAYTRSLTQREEDAQQSLNQYYSKIV